MRKTIIFELVHEECSRENVTDSTYPIFIGKGNRAILIELPKLFLDEIPPWSIQIVKDSQSSQHWLT